MARLWRTAAGRLLIAYLLLDLVLAVFTETAGARYTPHIDLVDQQIVWTALDAFLLWRVWRGGRVAWAVLLVLDIYGLAVMVLGRVGSWSAYAGFLCALVVTQTLIVLAPAVRHHVSRGQQVRAS
jgi:hypothetical protein